ncbi:myb-like protein D [Narcine bancroftii]|uniref:myb-like protein D n=1 Tax=Narcine bancroftii TaxID=1343680 RepID=UPI0038316283
MGCRCCRMIRRYIFGPAIVELPSTVRNEINCRNNETTFHNKDKTNHIVASSLDKVNLEEQDAEIKLSENNASKNTECGQNKIVEDAYDGVNINATRMLNNNQALQASSRVAPHPINTNNCSSYNIMNNENKNELAYHRDSGIESDCHIVNGLSTHRPVVVSADIPVAEKVTDNNKIANINNGKLSSMENDEITQNNLEADMREIRSLSNTSSNEENNALNGHKDLGSSSTNDGKFTKNLFEKEKFNLEIDDPEVAAALAALEAATAGEDDDLEE